MKNQFFYTRKEPIQPREEDKDKPLEYKEYLDSFNINFVIRSRELEDGTRLILLNDIHERLQEVPQFNAKRDKIVGRTKERNTFQSEIYLSKEDSERYVKQIGEKVDYEFC